MSEEDDSFELTIELTRGTSTDDRDKQRMKVSARTIDGLRSKVEDVKDEMESWADDFREIQPEAETVRDHAVEDDQSTLSEGSA